MMKAKTASPSKSSGDDDLGLLSVLHDPTRKFSPARYPDFETGQMLRKGWLHVPIEMVVQLRREKTDPSIEGHLPFVGMDDIESDGLTVVQTRPFAEMKSLGNRFHPGDMLYGRLRPYLNKTATMDRDGACSGELLVLTPSPAIAVRYLQYFMHGRRYVGWVSAAVSGDRPRVSFETLASFAIPLPPLAEQRRIVARIDALFAEIAEGEAALAEARKGIETFRRALLKAAVTGELTKDWRARNLVSQTHDSPARIDRGKAAGIANTELFDLPQGWIWTTLEALAISGPKNGYSPKKSSDGSGTLSLKLTATTRGQIDLSKGAVKALAEIVEPGSDLFLRSGDLLFQRGNTIEYVGIAAIYEGPPDKYVYPDLMIRVRMASPSLTQWTWRVANSPFGRKYLSQNATGTAGTMPKINGEVLRNLSIPLPPIAEIEEILRRVSDSLTVVVDTLAMLDAEAADAARLKQSILKAAFEGRLVPQDPNDEPASELLARLGANGSVAPAGGRTRRGRIKSVGLNTP